jgi:hypothetical protein
MFARVKKSGKYQYLQIVENRKEDGKVVIILPKNEMGRNIVKKVN